MSSARPPATVKLFPVLDEHQAGTISCKHHVFGFVEIQIKKKEKEKRFTCGRANLRGVWPR